MPQPYGDQVPPESAQPGDALPHSHRFRQKCGQATEHIRGSESQYIVKYRKDRIIMAILNIVKEGDPVLRKVCRPVTEFNSRLHTLLDDMTETLEESQGVGLAAPQIGMLRRYCVIEIGEGVIELVNPKIVAYSGEQEGVEGCLSFCKISARIFMLGFGRCKRFDAFLDRYNLGHQILGNVTLFPQFWQFESRNGIFLCLYFRLLFLKSILRFLCFFFGLLESRGEYSFQFPVFRCRVFIFRCKIFF